MNSKRRILRKQIDMTETQMTSESGQSSDKETKELYMWLYRIHWGKLRFLGSLRILSAIPFVGASIISVLNLPCFDELKVGVLLSDVWSGGPLIVFVVSLFTSNIIYQAACPPLIKNFESLADLYKHQLEIKKIQLEMYPNDEFQANLKHVAEFYIKNLNKGAFARWIALILFVSSWMALFYFFYKFRIFLMDLKECVDSMHP